MLLYHGGEFTGNITSIVKETENTSSEFKGQNKR